MGISASYIRDFTVIVLSEEPCRSQGDDMLSCGQVSAIHVKIGLWYRKISNIRNTKSQNLNDSPLVLQSSLSNPLKPGVKSNEDVVGAAPTGFELTKYTDTSLGAFL